MSENIEFNQKAIEDAKELSIAYYLLGLFIISVAVLLGFLVRFIQTGAFGNAQMYYTLMTLHGMAAFVGWGCFVAMGLTWYTLVKALDSPLHSVTLVKVIFWIFSFAVALLVIATLGGNFGGSWVFLYPITFYGYWDQWAAFMWNFAVLLAGVAIILYGIEILLTIHKAGYSIIDALGFEVLKKDFYHRERRVPLPVVPLAVIGLGMIIATIPFAYLLGYTLLEIIGVVGRMDALLAKNLLWWFGHPVVYLILFPVVSFFYTIVADYAGRPLIGERVTKFSWMLATIIQNVIGAHHVYADLVQASWIHVWSQFGTYIIIIPSLVSIFSIIVTIYVSKFKWNVVTQYMFVALTFWLLAGMSGWVNASMSLNIYIHNTLWVVAHFHTMAALALSTMLFGMGFYILKDYKGIYSEKLASQTLKLYVIGGVGFVHMWFMQGIFGGLRRTYYSTPDSMALLTWLSLPFALMLTIGFWLNAYNSFKSVFSKSTTEINVDASTS
jgi:cytochrome c oxidase subunit I